MNSEKLSPRQLAAAVMVGGLSTGAAAAGRADWRWLLLAAAAGVGVGWLLLRRVSGRRLHPALRALYGAFAVVLLADVLGRTAERVRTASGSGARTGWLLVLLALPVIWMGWGRASAFFRAVEIFWLGMAAATAAILLLGLPRVNWAWALEPAGDWESSLSAGALTMGTGLFVLPYLYKVTPEEGGARRGLIWLGALGAVSAALAALTAGLLRPGVSAMLDAPFFTAAGLLGDSARLEGLISALWLLPDLTLAGLLARSWGEERWPALAAVAALGLALTGVTDPLPEGTLAAGCLILVILTAALPPGAKR